MSDELTDDVISQWLEVAAPCLFAAWQYGPTPDDADPVAWFAEVYAQGARGPVHAVHVVGDDGRTVAVTGNGPRSAAHAKFMAWSSPGNVSKLLRDFRAMRDRAIAAERLLADERAAHAETSRDLDALLTALGAQVTPGGQTLDACEARRVADGMRRAKRAAEVMRRAIELLGVSAPAAPATVARPISEWHEDRGSALWWRFPVEEPPYSGSPLDSDWPGYHTHWTPIVCPDEPHSEADADPASRGPIGGGL